MVADGKISAEQASQLLSALGGDADDERNSSGRDAAAPAAEPSPPAAMPHFGSLWLIPMYIGLALFVCGALAVFPLYAESGSWLLVACGWPALIVGLFAMLAAWLARKWRWIHIRITKVDGSKRSIKLSFPLPLVLTAWVLRLGSRVVPKLKDTGVDEMIAALNEGLSGDQPLYVDVQEGDDGERVQVYIG